MELVFAYAMPHSRLVENNVIFCTERIVPVKVIKQAENSPLKHISMFYGHTPSLDNVPWNNDVSV